MNLNARDIVVVHIGFRFWIMSLLTSEDNGSKIEHKNCSIFLHFFGHDNSLVNILFNNIEQKSNMEGSP